VKVEGRTVTFRVSVDDEKEPIGDGTHERFIVDVQKVRERLLKKKARRS